MKRSIPLLVSSVLFTTAIIGCGGGSGGSSPAAQKTWGTPTAIEEGADSAHEPKVTVDNTGAAVATWLQRNASADEVIMVNRHTPAAGWTGPEQVSDSSATNKGYPRISEGGGNVFVIWTQDSAVAVNRFDSATTTWATPEAVSATTVGSAVADVSIAVDGSGNAIAIWREYSGNDQTVMANRYDATAGAWGTAEGLDSFVSIRAATPEVAMDAAGNGIAVWKAGNDVIAKHYDVGSGNWDATQTQLESGTGEAWYPEIAMNDAGEAIVAWHQYADGSFWANILSKRFVPGIGWEGTVVIGSNVDFSCYYPHVAISSAGTAIVVWYDWDEDIMANFYTPGIGWGIQEKIHQVDGYYYDPRPAINDSGDVVVVWDYEDGAGGGRIMANRYNSASGWGEEVILDDQTNDAWYPYVALDQSGNATVVWMQDMGIYDVMAVRLE